MTEILTPDLYGAHWMKCVYIGTNFSPNFYTE
jgi:hypothetical protein